MTAPRFDADPEAVAANAPEILEALDWLLGCIEARDRDRAARLKMAVACGHRVIAKVAKVTNGLPS